MTTRDELRDKLVTFVGRFQEERFGPVLMVEYLMPEVDAYVAEKLAERQAAIAAAIAKELQPGIPMHTLLSDWVRDFGKDPS